MAARAFGPLEQAAGLYDLLQALGFGVMAKQAKAERDPEKLRLYGGIVLKHAHPEQRDRIRQRLARLQLL